MKTTTLCFLLKGKKVLLGMKKRGFGIGKWNGIGGKVSEGEAVEEAAIRETKEEIGVEIELQDLVHVGEILFEFKDDPSWNQQCVIFVAEKWIGDPIESDEMRPMWHSIEQVPFENMWIDDPYWVPKVLAGKKIKAKFLFDKKGDELVKYEVREIEAGTVCPNLV